MADTRQALLPGTRIFLESGSVYEITGEPIGRGGGSLIYPAEQLYLHGETTVRAGIECALKECYPLSAKYNFTRNALGEIVSEDDEKAAEFLNNARKQLLSEGEISRKIYRSSSRLIPIREQANCIRIQMPGAGQDFESVASAVTIMDSFSSKGRTINELLKEYGHLTAAQTFHVARQILYALREIHEAGYLHLDLQDGNILLNGALEDESDTAGMIDFGCARKITDGAAVIDADEAVFSTDGFTAPEFMHLENGEQKLTCSTDLYSLGCLMLLMLTGKRSSSAELMRNTSGNYIPRFLMRQTACPKHLQDRMQKILARALNRNPEERYQTADEMLEELYRLEEALRPHRTALDNVDYEAFISYRHRPLDSAVARKLQTSLEHFHVQRDLRNEQKTSAFRRIFVDEGEISSGAYFGQQIEAALKNAQWLIVLCSPETPASKWVRSEIKTFLKYHERSRILAVLVEGDPETSFPQELLGASDAEKPGEEEVLAADIRGSSQEKILKNLRGDALYKLAAPMLGVSFDALKQRRKNYVMKRMMAAAAVITMLAVLFAGYSLNQNRRIQTAVKGSLMNQARYLTQEAVQQLNDRNAAGAVSTALKAARLGEGVMDLPVLAETENVLTKGLGLYTTPYSAGQYAAVNSYTLKRDVEDYFIVSEKQILIARDDSSIYFFDVEKNVLIDTFYVNHDGNSLSWFFSPELVNTKTNCFVFAADSTIYCYDFEKHTMVWRTGLDGTEDGEKYSLQDIHYVESRKAYLCMNSHKISLLSETDGSLIRLTELSSHIGISNYDANYADLSEDESLFVFYGHTYSEFDSEKDLFVYELSTEKIYALPIQSLIVSKLYFTEKNRLFVAGRASLLDPAFTLEEAIGETDYRKEDEAAAAAYRARFYLIDPTDTGGLSDGTFHYLWEQTLPFYYDVDITCQISKADASLGIITAGNRCAILSLEDGELEVYGETDAPIVAADSGLNADGAPYLVANTENGKVFHCAKSGVSTLNWFPDGIKCFHSGNGSCYLSFTAHNSNTIIRYTADAYDENYSVLATFSEPIYRFITDGMAWTYDSSSGILTMLSGSEEEGYKEVTADLSDVISVISYWSPGKEEIGGIYKGGERPQLVLFPSSVVRHVMVLVDTMTGEVTKYDIPDEGQSIYVLGPSKTALYYVLFNDQKQLTLCRFSAEEKSPQKLRAFSMDPSAHFSIGGTVADDDLGMFAIFHLDNGAIASTDFYSIDGNSKKVEELSSFSEDDLRTISFGSEQGKLTLYAVLAGKTYSVFNTGGKEICEIDTEAYVDDIEDIAGLSFSPDQRFVFAFYKKDDEHTTLVQYRLRDGCEVHNTVVAMGQKDLNDCYTDDNHLILTAKSSFADISLEEENWGVRMETGKMTGVFTTTYDEEKDRFYLFSHVRGGGESFEFAFFPRYSTEALLNRAEAYVFGQ